MAAHLRQPGPLYLRSIPVSTQPYFCHLGRNFQLEAQGLREVVGRDPGRVHEAEVSSPVIHLDLNTPEDYQRGLEMFKNL